MELEQPNELFVSFETKQSAWKTFITEMWFQHRDEILSWEQRQVDYDLKDYYNQHKWFLRKLFRAEGGKVL